MSTHALINFIDSTVPPVRMFGLTLQEVNPISYRECFLDWLDYEEEE